MTTEAEIKQQVREFYDQVGWKLVGDGVYQNARYEDLRLVSSEYITRCHQRVSRHIAPTGRFLLDAGSGPIQYPAYEEYSRGYQKRVCADISITALQEARQRIGDHGLFVVADIARLPFAANSFDGVVSLHTIHHLPQEEHIPAYRQVYRVLRPERSAALVNGWTQPLLMRLAEAPIMLRNRLYKALRRRRAAVGSKYQVASVREPKGTFVRKYNARWLERELGKYMPVSVLVWRSASVKFLRNYIHPGFGGRMILRILFWLEDRLPGFFGRHGQYPLIVISKPG
ncbi:MAG: methyltransferase domain-containing protein [Anaerolineae bacterium]|nr:methyltransferase domain-containing protein [Anaerolineae bacterium]